MIVRGTTLVEGRAVGSTIALAEPLSFWGGFDATTGRVTDKRHPDHGLCLSGAILVMSAARGSSSGSSVLAEAIRLGTAPAAFVLSSRDAILTVGCQVALELYGKPCPIVVVEPAALDRLATQASLMIDASTAEATIEAR